MNRLLLVDGHANLYRAFYALRVPLRAPDGTPTGAVYGFLRMLHKMLRELSPTHVAVAFDLSRETFRTRMMEAYKAHRQPMPEDLRRQIPLVQKALELLKVRLLAVPDVEADDMLASLAEQATAAGIEVVVATVDKDLMQVVRDPHIKLWHARLERLLDEEGVNEVFGVPPVNVVDVLALEGDSADNIPGCPGIGEKIARELIRRFGSLEELYARLNEVAPERIQKALEANREQVELSRELAAVKRNVPIPCSLEELALQPPDRRALGAFYRELGFASLLAELGEELVPKLAGPTVLPSMNLGKLQAQLDQAPFLALVRDQQRLCLGAAGLGYSLVSPEEGWRLVAPHWEAAWTYDAKSLLAFLRDQGISPQASCQDVMLAAYVLAPGEDIGLATVCQRYGVPFSSGTSREEAQAVLALAPRLLEALAGEGVEKVYRELEIPLVSVLEDMERTGIKLDVEFLGKLRKRVDQLLQAKKDEIYQEAGGEFNINSPKQLAEVLFHWKGMPVLRRTSKTRFPSTDGEVLAELSLRGFQLPSLILEYRELAKLKSTYLDALPRQLGTDGRIHTRFNQAVTATGRLSSSEPNLQNIPIRSELGREVRRAFVAEAGKLLVVADYSQIELRVLAHLSQDPVLLAAFAKGEDIHGATAALIFGVPKEQVTGEMRRAAKTINFGLIYGMGAYALGRELGVDQREAQAFIDAYFARFPRVKEYLQSVKEEARKAGKVRTLFGRVRYISGLESANGNIRGNAERMAINAPVQGTAADLMKLGMITLHRRLAALGCPARILLQVHDELVLEAEADLADETAALVRDIMEGVATLAVPLKVDVGVGATWTDAKG